MSSKTVETPMYLEHAGRTYRLTGGDEEEDARLRQRQAAIKERLVVLAGGASEANKLLAELEDLYGDEERLAVERLFNAVGELVVYYSGPGPDLWRALYFKLTGFEDHTLGPASVNGDHYEAGEEWRYLWGERWRDRARDMGIAVPAAGGDDEA